MSILHQEHDMCVRANLREHLVHMLALVDLVSSMTVLGARIPHPAPLLHSWCLPGHRRVQLSLSHQARYHSMQQQHWGLQGTGTCIPL